VTSLATSPLRVYERLRWRTVLSSVTLPASPIFIIGHWRRGTTHLHNILCQDPSLGYVTTYHALAPDLLFEGERFLKPVLRKLAPTRRPMDNMAHSLDGPQEEEQAMACLSAYSIQHAWSFPRRAQHYFERYVLCQGLSTATLARWQVLYDGVLRKATLAMDGRRLILKNPANTGRIPLLLAMFPDAKFIHICRNPYTVFLSARHFQEQVTALCAFQRIARQKNTFDVTDEVVALVHRHWHFAFEEWGYAADGRVP
jgi:hypothetical protein